MKNLDLKGNLPHKFYEELWKLSIQAIGRTSPNPPVACIITDSKNIVAKGSTEPPGKKHAEIVALEELDKKIYTPPLQMYVTLEPCSTYGRTLPCVLKIIKYNKIINKIYIENLDPNLNKTGIQYLINYDFEIERISIFQKPHFALNSFFSTIQNKKPEYYIKIATDKNGLMGISSKSLLVTGLSGKYLTMLLRAKVDAVMVGPGTISIDQPELTFRKIENMDSIQKEFEKEIIKLKKEIFLLRENNQPYDEFIRGIILFHKEILEETNFYNYQPKRVFLLGRIFKNFYEFYKKQIHLTEKYHQNCYFLIPEKYKYQYDLDKLDKEFYMIVPNRENSNFISYINQFFIEIEAQKVLIEAGLNLFHYFYNNFKIDKIYWIQNQKAIEVEIENAEKKYWNFKNFRLNIVDQIELGDLRIYSLKH